MSIPRRLALVVAVVLLATGPAAAQADAWATAWSERLGVTLLAEFDASGPDAWDRAAHPLVFISTEGPGYSGLMSGLSTPGLAVIDAITHESVATARHTLEGVSTYFEPHGLGVSPDGRWIYLPTGTSPGFGDVGSGRLLGAPAREPRGPGRDRLHPADPGHLRGLLAPCTRTWRARSSSGSSGTRTEGQRVVRRRRGRPDRHILRLAHVTRVLEERRSPRAAAPRPRRGTVLAHPRTGVRWWGSGCR